MSKRAIKKTIKSVLPPRLKSSVKKFVSIIAPNIVPDRKKERVLASQWCDERAVEIDAAIKVITGSNITASFYTIHAFEYAEANDCVKSCPIKMGGPGSLEIIYQLSEYSKARRVIETGVAYGWSSLVFLLSLKNRNDSLLISTDRPYPQKKNDEYVGIAVPKQLHTMWRLLNGPDSVSIPMALEIAPTIDICHYDSDKTYDGRAWAYPLLWKALRSGGFFISDDIGDNFAFRDFCNQIKILPLIVKQPIVQNHKSKYVGILIKP